MIRQVTIVRAILLITLLFGATYGQDEPRRIGSIDFYGHAGLNLEQTGIEEERAWQLANTDNTDEIMKSLQSTGSVP